jgi:putative membrane protein
VTDPSLPTGRVAIAGDAAPAPLAGGGSSALADGDWHRLHPLTPLFKGGIALIIVIGILLANLRDRIIYGFISVVAPHELADDEYDYENGDPIGWAIDWTVANNMVIVALLVLLAIVAIVTGLFWLSWRVHQFRITDEHVEVRKGMIFRTHRRAPLDRVQGVNLTRPFPPRLIGMAKLEVDGAGTDANVPLEYLAVRRAEEVRADILRLASGARAAKRAAREGTAPAAGGAGAGAAPHGRLQQTVSAGVQELVEGADLADVAPESVVKLPIGRVIASQLLDAVVWIIFFGGIFLVSLVGLIPVALTNEDGEGFLILGITALTTGVPMALAVVSVVWSGLSKALRYAIAPTPDGVRVTFGLLTTVTQTIPPGRIHAVELVQPLLWRPFGWWRINVNRVSGQSAAAQASAQQQFSQVLPVGTRDDAIRVLQLILPYLPAQDLPLVVDHGVLGPVEGDPYRVMARRAWWRRFASSKRHGALVTAYALHLRRGRVWRRQAILLLARLQGVSISQGPIGRLQTVGSLQAHTVTGAVSGTVVGLDRTDLMALFAEVRTGAVAAAAADRTHRWREHGDAAVGGADGSRAVPAMAAGAIGAPVAGAGQPGAAAWRPGGEPGADQ